MNARLGFGLLNGWNKHIGKLPFERFYLGGLSGLTLDGREHGIKDMMSKRFLYYW